MNKAALFCENCGASLPLDARFCEQCGAAAAIADPFPLTPVTKQAQTPKPAPVVTAGERIIGHIPVDFQESGRWGRTIYREGELLITSWRLLYLHSGFWSDDERWFDIQQQWSEPFGGDIDEVPIAKLRAIADAYNFAGPDWDELYSIPPDKLLVDNKHNFSVALDVIVSASITLDDAERDQLDLVLEDGRKLHFQIYLALGGPCVRFLKQALTAQRVQVYSNS